MPACGIGTRVRRKEAIFLGTWRTAAIDAPVATTVASRSLLLKCLKPLRLPAVLAAPLLSLCLSLPMTLALAGCPRPGGSDGDLAKSQIRVDLAKDFLSKHELEAATAETERALAFAPQNEEAYLVRGIVSLVRASDNLRITEVEACLTGVDAEAVQRQIDESLIKAELDFRRATELAPDFGEAWSNRGVVKTLLDDPEAAVAMLTKALENPVRLQNPSLTRAHLGWAHFHRGDMVAAVTDLRQALQFQPGMCVANYRLGRVYFAREEWEKAAEQFQLVSDSSDCGSQEAKYFLMKSRNQQGLLDDARAAAQACINLAPKSCYAQRCRAESNAIGQGDSQ
jgi:type IV pilus assembly protein PilF